MAQDFYFLLMPGFSAIGFISALEPLRVANRFGGELYRWHVLSAAFICGPPPLACLARTGDD